MGDKAKIAYEVYVSTQLKLPASPELPKWEDLDEWAQRSWARAVEAVDKAAERQKPRADSGRVYREDQPDLDDDDYRSR